jgi:hypothetical protein
MHGGTTIKIKYYENPSSGSRLFHAERQTDRQTDMTKLIITYGNFVKAPKLLAIPQQCNPHQETGST